MRTRSRATGSVWLTWEIQRRSETLAKFVGADYQCLLLDAPRIARYPILIWRTSRFLIKRKPALVYVQNPSIVLAAAITLDVSARDTISLMYVS